MFQKHVQSFKNEIEFEFFPTIQRLDRVFKVHVLSEQGVKAKCPGQRKREIDWNENMPSDAVVISSKRKTPEKKKVNSEEEMAKAEKTYAMFVAKVIWGWKGLLTDESNTSIRTKVPVLGECRSELVSSCIGSVKMTKEVYAVVCRFQLHGSLFDINIFLECSSLSSNKKPFEIFLWFYGRARASWFTLRFVSLNCEHGCFLFSRHISDSWRV